MQYRTFGRSGWKVSEVGYGMWGMGSWSGSDDKESERSLDLSIELGCNFFDTAWFYGKGKSENLLGALVKRNKGKKLYLATKIPPKNFVWPPKIGSTLQECFPNDHIVEYTEKSLKNLGLDSVDLQQFHAWDDSWTKEDSWKKAVEKLKKDGKIRAMGISINRWEPENVIKTLETGLIDSVQLVYNIFDQAPEDKLFPVCRKHNIAVIVRVPFDEGTLTGSMTKETTFPKDDWRAFYFNKKNLDASMDRVEKLKAIVPKDMTLPGMALRFVLSNKDVSTVIPGMRREKNVRANIGASDGKGLSKSVIEQLRKYRWDRTRDWLA
jgi:aryl-alcohol dehydrogenase-like predicted oxidoreductase